MAIIKGDMPKITVRNTRTLAEEKADITKLIEKITDCDNTRGYLYKELTKLMPAYFSAKRSTEELSSRFGINRGQALELVAALNEKGLVSVSYHSMIRMGSLIEVVLWVEQSALFEGDQYRDAMLAFPFKDYL